MDGSDSQSSRNAPLDRPKRLFFWACQLFAVAGVQRNGAQERTHALGLYNCFCAILCGVNLGDTPQDTPLYHSLPWLYADITAVARLRRPLRKQSNVPVKLRRLALELDDTATADSSATRLSVPEYGAWAFQTLYSGKVYLHGKMAGPTVRDHFPASLAHLSHRLG